jgi:dTDP-4-amino-4,6-dideoxygalactose transaminase
MHKIPLLIPQMPTADELRPFLERIDQARWYTNFGPLALELEGELLRRLGAGGTGPLFGASLSNCTVGLELSLAALALKPGARVLVPGLTFVATAAAVARVGCEPVISDVDPGSWLLTPRIARRAAAETPVDAVMPVSTYGCAQDAAAWDEFAEATGVPVVLDAAGAFGNQRAGRRIALVFSLHATKVLSAAEGGFVASADAGFIARIKRLANFGIGSPGGFVDQPGTNAKLSEYHAAVALAMLQRWDELARRRIALHRSYLEALAASCPAVTLQQRAADGVYSIMPVLLPDGASAAAIGEALGGQGIETRRWYCPTLEQHPAFASCRIAGELEAVRALGERLLALPFHLYLEPGDVTLVCGRLRAALGRLAG